MLVVFLQTISGIVFVLWVAVMLTLAKIKYDVKTNIKLNTRCFSRFSNEQDDLQAYLKSIGLALQRRDYGEALSISKIKQDDAIVEIRKDKTKWSTVFKRKDRIELKQKIDAFTKSKEKEWNY